MQRELRKRRPKPHAVWHFDDVYLEIDGAHGLPITRRRRRGRGSGCVSPVQAQQARRETDELRRSDPHRPAAWSVVIVVTGHDPKIVFTIASTTRRPSTPVITRTLAGWWRSGMVWPVLSLSAVSTPTATWSNAPSAGSPATEHAPSFASWRSQSQASAARCWTKPEETPATTCAWP